MALVLSRSGTIFDRVFVPLPSGWSSTRRPSRRTRRSEKTRIAQGPEVLGRVVEERVRAFRKRCSRTSSMELEDKVRMASTMFQVQRGNVASGRTSSGCQTVASGRRWNPSNTARPLRWSRAEEKIPLPIEQKLSSIHDDLLNGWAELGETLV